MKKLIRASFLILIIGYVAMMIISQYAQFNYIKAKQQEIAEQISVLKNENKILQHQINISNSVSYIEKAAREQLGMVKNGEVRYLNDMQSNK